MDVDKNKYVAKSPFVNNCSFENGLLLFSYTLSTTMLLNNQIWRQSVAELLGTAVLVFMIDTIVISSHQTDTKTPKLIMAFLISVTVAILVLAIFPVSGGHINPVVSMSAAFIGLISIPNAAIFILAQCTGAVLGALALKAVVSNTIGEKYSLGGCTVTIITPGPDGPITTGVGTAQAISLEIICSFVFLFASRGIAFDQRQVQMVGRVIVCSIIGILAGVNVFVSMTVTATKGYSGAGVNPARCLGPAIVRGGHLWNGHWIFWAGPAIASMSFYLYTKIIPSEHFRPEEFKHDFFGIFRAMLLSDRGVKPRN